MRSFICRWEKNSHFWQIADFHGKERKMEQTFHHSYDCFSSQFWWRLFWKDCILINSGEEIPLLKLTYSWDNGNTLSLLSGCFTISNITDCKASEASVCSSLLNGCFAQAFSDWELATADMAIFSKIGIPIMFLTNTLSCCVKLDLFLPASKWPLHLRIERQLWKFCANGAKAQPGLNTVNRFSRYNDF